MASSDDLPGDAEQYPWLSLVAVKDDQPTYADGYDMPLPYPKLLTLANRLSSFAKTVGNQHVLGL